MVTVIVIIEGPGTGDPEPSAVDHLKAAEQLRQFAEELQDEQAKEWPREVITHDWPNPITVCEMVRVGRSGPGRVNVVCGRYPSGFK